MSLFTVLVAEDEPLERDALETIIRTHHADTVQLLVVGSGREAIEASYRQRIDIAILDIKIPAPDGLVVAAHLREHAPACRIIFLTAFDYFDYARQAVQLHADDFLVKPADDDTVLRTLARLLAEIDQQRARTEAYQNDHRRLLEARRFLETELMDDLLFGNTDRELLLRGLELLGVPDASGRALMLEGDYRSYPTPVASRTQRAVLLRRVVQAQVASLKSVGFTVFARSDEQRAALLVVEHPAGALSDDFAAVQLFERSFLEARTALTVDVGLSAYAATPTDLQRAMTQARRALEHAVYTRESGAGERDAVGRLHLFRDRSVPNRASLALAVDAALERRLLSAVLSADRYASHEAARSVVQELTAQPHDAAAAAAYLQQLIHFVEHSVRLQRSTVLPDGPAVYAAAPFRAAAAAFEARIAALCDGLESAPPADNLMRTLTAYVESHLESAVSLEEVAAAARISPSHCSRLFSKHTGETFSAYVARARGERARARRARARAAQRTRRHDQGSIRALWFSGPQLFLARIHAASRGHAACLSRAPGAPRAIRRSFGTPSSRNSQDFPVRISQSGLTIKQSIKGRRTQCANLF